MGQQIPAKAPKRGVILSFGGKDHPAGHEVGEHGQRAVPIAGAHLVDAQSSLVGKSNRPRAGATCAKRLRHSPVSVTLEISPSRIGALSDHPWVAVRTNSKSLPEWIGVRKGQANANHLDSVASRCRHETARFRWYG